MAPAEISQYIWWTGGPARPTDRRLGQSGRRIFYCIYSPIFVCMSISKVRAGPGQQHTHPRILSNAEPPTLRGVVRSNPSTLKSLILPVNRMFGVVQNTLP